jgi:uncharacterized SAM-binding protein YcdF (DUF218 family)
MRLFYGALALFAVGFSVWFSSAWKSVSSVPITSWTTNHHAQCAVVLTGGAGRVREGFDLLSQGRIEKLIVSGVNPNSDLREIFPEWPYYGRLNADDVILERRSTTTYGNAQQSAPLVEALRCRSVILITSQLHMFRAERIFRATLPVDIEIHGRATASPRGPFSWLDQSLEVMKVLFYSLWAFR